MDPPAQGYHGLTEKQAKDKLKNVGPNTLTEKKGLPGWVLFLKELTQFFSLLLWAGGIACFIGFGI